MEKAQRGKNWWVKDLAGKHCRGKYRLGKDHGGMHRSSENHLRLANKCLEVNEYLSKLLEFIYNHCALQETTYLLLIIQV